MLSGVLVVDSHLHLVHPQMENPWVDSGDFEADCKANAGCYRGPKMSKTWTESEFRADVGQGRFGVHVTAAVFVECCNDPPVEGTRALRVPQL